MNNCEGPLRGGLQGVLTMGRDDKVCTGDCPRRDHAGAIAALKAPGDTYTLSLGSHKERVSAC
jgi:hypothetical protein